MRITPQSTHPSIRGVARTGRESRRAALGSRQLRALLRLPWLGYAGVDSLSVDNEWRHRIKAELGTGAA